MRKQKNRKLRCARASVSIMLSFLMLPVYTFAGAIVDSARVASAKQMTAGAADITLNAGLSDYNDVLKSVYGLFAMSADEAELQENLSDYFYRTVNNTALGEEDEESRKYIDSIGSFFSDPSNADFDNLIRLSAGDFDAAYVDGADLANPTVLKNQIIEYMKYTGPVSMGEGFISKLGVFKDFESQNDAVEARVEYDQSLEKVNRHCIEIYKNASAYNSFLGEQKISDSETMRSNILRVQTLYTEAVRNLVMYKSLAHLSEESGSKPSDETNKAMEECRNKADELFTEASDILCSSSENAYTALEYLENAKSSLESLLYSVKDSELKGENWKNAIDALSDGEVKDMMQNDYDASMGSMKTEDIEHYLEVTQNNIDSFRKITEYVTDVKFFGNRVCEYINYSEKYLHIIPDYSVNNFDETSSPAADIINSDFTFPSGDIPADYSVQGTEYAFYRYLSETCGSVSVSETDKKSAKKFLETLKNLGIPEQSEMPENIKSGLLSKISEKKLENIKKEAETPDETDEFSVESSEADSESMLENQQSLFENTSEFLKNIGELAEKTAGSGLEDLLLTEYMTEMFSCYTSDKECKNNVISNIVPKTITGSVLSEENNPFYKAEAEYILWGNEDLEKNIRSTEALIFGTRFLFNNIYAFTDSEIKTFSTTAATAISGWTGFGIPIVRTVIIMSLALAESAEDVKTLMSGGAVPVYKTTSTWKTKPSGLIKELGDNSAGQIQNISADKSEKSADNLTEDKTLTLNYREYIKIFIFLNTFSENKERAMLTRTAVLIDVNITGGMQNNTVNGVKHRADPDFDISKAYTMLKTDVSADIGTCFLGALVPDMFSESDEDVSDGLKKEKNIVYHNVLSY